MLRQIRVLGVAALTSALLCGTAFADHMTGVFVDTKNGTSFIDLVQSGNFLEGQITGDAVGYLYAQQVGQDAAEGMININSRGEMPVEIMLDGEFLDVTVYSPLETVTIEFINVEYAASAPAETEADDVEQTDPRDDQQDEPEVDQQNTLSDDTEDAEETDDGPPPVPTQASYYYVGDGAQQGPVSIEELTSLIEEGTVSADTLVWKRGEADWAELETLPELAELIPPPVQYYVAIDGAQQGPMPAEDVARMIEAGEIGRDTLGWTSGMADWMAFSQIEAFADAFGGPEVVSQDDEHSTPEAEDAGHGDDDHSHENEMGEPNEDDPPSRSEDEADAEAGLDALLSQVREEYSVPENVAQPFDACMTRGLDALSAEDTAMVSSGSFGEDDQWDALFDNYPGLSEALNSCVDRYGQETIRTALPDGRMLIVSGNGEMASSEDGDARSVSVDGKTVRYADETLTIDGESVEYPAFEYVLEVTFAPDGSYELEADG
ncbi:hypothetical protein GCM10007989_27770 [Devosia pacifica]|uniref:GYF domain-containing protein n=1 Tax=Devosia pacifica TaxID=1335967 RepID=A0A918SBD9_9HYPH|nr:DUF4339 domain-containing protein [Devosia pacifica]GHA30439.1 hypothetical protein GCM10007989_27770 [Devosia pacifica]